MAEDTHLGTGEYDPEKYWSARARTIKGSCFSAVCVFGATEDENNSAHRVQHSVLHRALKNLDLKGKEVLEYGCGVGRWIPYFKRCGSIWHGIDISNDMLSMAKKVYKDVDLKKIIDNKIPYPDRSMDFVYSINVIHHNPYDAQDNIVSEMVRVLRKSGHLLLFEDLGEKGQFNMFPRDRKSWIKLVEKYGMTICWQGGVRYWILRDLVYKVIRQLSKMKRVVGNEQQLSYSNQALTLTFLRKVVGRLDLIIDQYIYPFLPRRFQSAVILLFKKFQESR
jgi:ubiquinone/menaquinone biosynthesis C-methylase UbiE